MRITAGKLKKTSIQLGERQLEVLRTYSKEHGTTPSESLREILNSYCSLLELLERRGLKVVIRPEMLDIVDADVE